MSVPQQEVESVDNQEMLDDRSHSLQNCEAQDQESVSEQQMEIEQPHAGYPNFITNPGECDENSLRQINDQQNTQINIEAVDSGAENDVNNRGSLPGGVPVNSRGSTSPRRGTQPHRPQTRSQTAAGLLRDGTPFHPTSL